MIDSDSAPFETPYKFGKLVISKSGVQGSFDSQSVDGPFVFWHENRFHMLFTGFDGVGYQTALAVSDDLIHWEKQGLVFGRRENDPYLRYNAAMSSILRDDEIGASPNLKKVNGRYLATWHAYPEAGYEEGQAVIGLAWSDNLIDWERTEPVLRAQDGAPWEKGGLYKSYLLESDGIYYLFYNAKDTPHWPWREQSGVATSKDLLTWTRHSGNPILANGPAGSPDELFASDPMVLRKGKQWIIHYFGLAKDGHARDLLALGDDPFHPKKTGKIIVDIGPPGSIDAVHAHKPNVISWKGDLYHFYNAVTKTDGKEERGITVARSRPWD